MSLPTDQPLHTPQGRSLTLREDSPEQETLQLRNAQGELECELKLTRDGPVLRLSSERIELHASETVAVTCKRFEVQASESAEILSKGSARVHADGELELHSDAEMRLRSEDEIKAIANMIWLN
ncbi:MAG: hypothetical protein VX899_22670 [Myxococcota bacterium]|nr:hypothetical protein [Myxococcota bacterium]